MSDTKPSSIEAQRAAMALGLACALFLSTGCKAVSPSNVAVGPGYSASNIHKEHRKLAADIRRVAVLPSTCDTTDANLGAGRETIETLLREELGKTKKFEVVTVSPEQLRQWTGRKTWAAEDVLPTTLLKTLREKLDCDVVLFSRVTQFRAYPPLAVGLSLKLIVASDAEQLWALDEVFDAGDPSVAVSARRFQQARDPMPAALADSRGILVSPSGFGRYAASAAFETLPSR